MRTRGRAWLLLPLVWWGGRCTAAPPPPPCLFANASTCYALTNLGSTAHAVNGAFCPAQGVDTTSYSLFTTVDIAYTRFVPTSPTQGVWLDGRNTTPAGQALYQYEATERWQQECLLCRYNADPFFWQGAASNSPLYLPLSGGLRNPNWEPMFGPCFDGQPALPAPCAQNVVLFPPGFVGTYFYPLQQPSTAFATPFPVHLYLTQGYSTADPAPAVAGTVAPSMYGLGKAAVQTDLGTFYVYNTTTGRVDAVLTQNFTAPYTTTPAGVEQWPKWAQHWCAAGCHRDSQYFAVCVNATRDLADPRNGFLSRFTGPTVVNTSANSLLRCNVCPPGQAAYYWDDDTDSPKALAANVAAVACFPWFGVLPAMVVDYQDPSGMDARFNTTTVQHGCALDGVIAPASETRVVATPCPRNTYNRVCAHAKRYYFQVGTLTEYATGRAAPAAPYFANYSCAPCPPGWSSAAGAWYCLPPPGAVFAQPYPSKPLQRLRNVTNPWASRDYYQAEFECGYSAAHCLQCADYGAAGMLPADFNELFLFGPMLATRPCAPNNYCPDAFTEVPCPSATPYSPGNVSSAAQCGCFAGGYLRAGACAPCSADSSCPLGQYRPRRCLAFPGATADPPCTPCANVPAGATAVAGSAEVVVAATGQTLGLCSFQCPYAARLQVAPGAAFTTNCGTPYVCAPVGVMRIGGVAVYEPNADTDFDGFDAGVCLTNGNPVAATLGLTNLLQTAASNPASWGITTLTCGGQQSGPCSGASGMQLCYNTRADGTAAGWYDLASDTPCAPCPRPTLPAGAEAAAGANDATLPEAAACAAVGCGTDGTRYWNATAWACLSCAARAAAVCTVGNRTQLRGQGCQGLAAPFNLANPNADCVACGHTPQQVPAGYWLNFAAAGGCAVQACTVNPTPHGVANLYYQTQNCTGGLSDSVWAPCNGTQCGTGSFQASACTPYTDFACQPCTRSSPGRQRVQDCLGRSDALWVLCPAGAYCDGSGPAVACPDGKTSDPGTASPGFCYCPVGTVQSGGACAPFTCPGAAQAPGVPGPSLVGPDYMYLSGHSTACAPCGGRNASSPAQTRGSAIGLDACVCPAGQYAAAVAPANDSQRAAIACAACPAAPPACARPEAVGPTPCWRGDARAPVDTCACAAPPFGTLAGGAGCAFVCAALFTATASASGAAGALLASANATGSALHAPAARSLAGWTRFVQPAAAGSDNSVYGGYDVAALAMTADAVDGACQAGEPQFALWALPMCLNVYFTQVPTAGAALDAAVANADYYTTHAWQPVDLGADGLLTDQQGTLYSIVGLAVTPWQRTVGPQGQMARIESVYVAAVLLLDYDAGSPGSTRKLQVVPKILDFGTAFTGPAVQGWGDAGYAGPASGLAAVDVVTAGGLELVGVAATTVVPGVQLAQQAVFYLAYNAGGGCGDGGGGLVYVAPWAADAALQFLGVCQNAPGPMAAFALTADTGASTVTAYFAYRGAPDVYVVLFATATSATPAVAFYGPAGGTPTSLLALFVAQPAVLATVVNTTCPSSNAGRACLLAADAVQRTLLPVEGLPWGAAPAVGPVGAPAPLTVPGGAGATVVVAYADGLFAVDLDSCGPTAAGVPQYWDGQTQQCLQHQCVRDKKCGPNQVVQNTYECVCAPGLTGADCTLPCPQGEYCVAGVATACPGLGMGTPGTGATSVDACTCVTGTADYFAAAAGGCLECPTTAWCPDGWSAQACPGAYDALRMSGRTPTQYPVGCVCAAGSTGPACGPCPAGSICPASTAAAAATVVNMAVAVTPAALLPGFAPAAAAAALQAGVLAALQGLNRPPAYLLAPAQLQQRLYVAYVAPTNRTAARFTLMLQVDSDADAAAAAGWGATLAAAVAPAALAAAGVGTPLGVAPPDGPAEAAVPSNVPAPCPAGHVPAPTADACVCAAGYAGAACAACAANTYKAAAGPGVCAPCGVGLASLAGSANCSAAPAPGPGGAAASVSVLTIALAAGGGLVVLLTALACCLAGPAQPGYD